MFRTSLQKHDALSALARSTIGRGYWTREGPTEQTKAMIAYADSHLEPSSSDHVGDREVALLRAMVILSDVVEHRAPSTRVGMDVIFWTLPRAWLVEFSTMLGAWAEGFKAVDRYILSRAMAVHGAQLIAMHVADPKRWRELLVEGISIARSKYELAAVYGIDIGNVYGWLDEANLRAEADVRFATLRAERAARRAANADPSLVTPEPVRVAPTPTPTLAKRVQYDGKRLLTRAKRKA